MNKKIIRAIVTGVILILTVVIWYVFSIPNREQRKSQSTANIIQEENQASQLSQANEVLPNEKKAESDKQQNSIDTTHSLNKENTEEIPAQIEKKINCKFKAKEGNKDNRAILTWTCTDIYNWSCNVSDFEARNVNIKNVKLPSGSLEVFAEKASLKTESSTLGYTQSEIDSASNFYYLKCRSASGKLAKFEDVYFNYEL